VSAASPPRAEPHGVLVVDKPRGPTSHDVVGRVRRALGTRRVGHAGTLDPMASGVLVVLVGEGTKLGPYLTAHDKRYEARVALGVGTTTLDAEGEPVLRGEVPDDVLRSLEAVARGEPVPDASVLAAALAAERARTLQTPPAHSAIKIGGRKAYDLARAGRDVELAPREVLVRAIDVLAASPARDDALAWLDLTLDVGKGYYVRSLARDLGERLGVPAHLTRLRRLASGPFTIQESTPLDDRDRLGSSLRSIEDAVRRSLPLHTLTDEGVVRAKDGKRLTDADFVDAPRASGPVAWMSRAGELRAIGERHDDGEHVVVRGFVTARGPAEDRA
jgi:tRNA pseudouridine55 synthase